MTTPAGEGAATPAASDTTTVAAEATTTTPATTTAETPPAPTPLPIKEATPEPKQPETPTVDVQPVTYDPTGDPGLDVALQFVGNLGIGLDHPAMKATEKGDFSVLKAHLGALGDKAKGWEHMVALGERAFADHQKKTTEAAAASQAAVEAVAGSKEAWAEMKAWAASNASPDEKAALNAMFDAGPVQARAAALAIASAYSKAKGTVVNPAAVTRNAGANTGADTTTGPLAPRDYHAAVRALHAKLGNRMDASPEYAALKSRLAAYKRG